MMLSQKMQQAADNRAKRIADKYINSDGSSLSESESQKYQKKSPLTEDQVDILRYIFLPKPRPIHKILAAAAFSRMFKRTTSEINTVLAVLNVSNDRLGLLKMKDAKKDGRAILAKLKYSMPHESFLDERWKGAWVIVFHNPIPKGTQSYGWQTLGAGGGWLDCMFEGWVPLPEEWQVIPNES